MLEKSKSLLTSASVEELEKAETVALRFLTSELEQNLMPEDRAAATAAAHKDARDEVWLRTVLGILLGLRLIAGRRHLAEG